LDAGLGSGNDATRRAVRGIDDGPVQRPDPLRPRDRVRIVAPSGPFDRTLLLRGAGFLGERYRVELDWRIFDRHGFLAGGDAERLAELNAALRSREARAIVTARGGYGLTRIAHLADWGALCERPKWLIGFSDATVLHVEAARVGVASLHAHNAAGLGRGDAHARAAWLSALEAPAACRRFSGLSIWQAGRARGLLAGGNLTLLATCAMAGRLALPHGCVLAIEDVSEAPYRIDRMLSALLAGGSLDRVSAVVVGDFVDCEARRYAVTAEDVLRERLAQLRVPVLAGFRFGHGRWNEPLPFGLPAEVDAQDGTFVICP
jgi:muramoyltetrapeptide carboxypeptidase